MNVKGLQRALKGPFIISLALNRGARHHLAVGSFVTNYRQLETCWHRPFIYIESNVTSHCCAAVFAKGHNSLGVFRAKILAPKKTKNKDECRLFPAGVD